MKFDKGHPYRWRTWIRCHLPWFLIDLGIAKKAVDCGQVDAEHHWYNQDNEYSACYHCDIVRQGQLWKQ